MDPGHDSKIMRIIVAGDQASGKTALLNWLINGRVVHDHLHPTTAAALHRTRLEIEGKHYRLDLRSLDRVEDFLQEANEAKEGGNMARILIGCKADLEEYRAISYSTAQKLAETNKMLHFEASTKSSGNYMGRLLDISNFIIERLPEQDFPIITSNEATSVVKQKKRGISSIARGLVSGLRGRMKAENSTTLSE
eukprot:gene2367-8067_t